MHHARERLLGASGMPLPLYKRDRGVPGKKKKKTGGAADEQRLRTLKDRIPTYHWADG